MANELTVKQKKEWAQMLYLSDQYEQKDIAAKVKVNKNTISRWVNDEKWDLMKKSMLTTKTEQLSNLYTLLSKITKKLKDEDSIGDSKIADMYVKYTAAINNLETDTSIGQLMEAFRMLTNWLQNIDPVFALGVLNHCDAFIKEKLKRF
jgi:DNA-binding XRE family transcriptional regulator